MALGMGAPPRKEGVPARILGLLLSPTTLRFEMTLRVTDYSLKCG